MKKIEEQLAGGDLRSIGKVNKLVASISSPADIEALITLLSNTDRLLRMRATDALEKATRKRYELLQPHKKELLYLCNTDMTKELKWHISLLVSRLSLNSKELGKIWQLFTNWVLDKKESRIVRVNAIQSLYNLLPLHPELMQDFIITINEVKKENIPSIHARLRILKLV